MLFASYRFSYPEHQRNGEGEYCFGDVRPCVSDSAQYLKTSDQKLMWLCMNMCCGGRRNDLGDFGDI